MTQIDFEVVRLTGEKSVKCAKCGKRLLRRRMFWQTVNPWNRDAWGMGKSREQIARELRTENEEWKAAPEICEACAKEGCE